MNKARSVFMFMTNLLIALRMLSKRNINNILKSIALRLRRICDSDEKCVVMNINIT